MSEANTSVQVNAADLFGRYAQHDVGCKAIAHLASSAMLAAPCSCGLDGALRQLIAYETNPLGPHAGVAPGGKGIPAVASAGVERSIAPTPCAHTDHRSASSAEVRHEARGETSDGVTGNAGAVTGGSHASFPSNVPTVKRFSGWTIAMMSERPDCGYVLGRDYDAAMAEIERLTRERDEWRRGSAHVNERLLGEIERLTSAAASCCCSRCAGEIKRLRHDLDRVMARETHYLNESERLRGALENVRVMARAINGHRTHWTACEHEHPWCKVEVMAAQALAHETGARQE